MISWGHIDGVRAENGPPGVGLNSEEPLYGKVAATLTDSTFPSPTSSSSSDNVSTVWNTKIINYWIQIAA